MCSASQFAGWHFQLTQTLQRENETSQIFLLSGPGYCKCQVVGRIQWLFSVAKRKSLRLAWNLFLLHSVSSDLLLLDILQRHFICSQTRPFNTVYFSNRRTSCVWSGDVPEFIGYTSFRISSYILNRQRSKKKSMPERFTDIWLRLEVWTGTGVPWDTDKMLRKHSFISLHYAFIHSWGRLALPKIECVVFCLKACYRDLLGFYAANPLQIHC